MPLTYTTGNLFDSKAKVLVNPVNCYGVMGAGLAKQFKTKLPYQCYRFTEYCRSKYGTIPTSTNPSMVPGMLWMYQGKLLGPLDETHRMLCFPTKLHWSEPSKLEYIEAGLVTFVSEYTKLDIGSIAFPCLGCGLGQLHWDDVQPLMDKYLSPLANIDIEIVQPVLHATRNFGAQL